MGYPYPNCCLCAFGGAPSSFFSLCAVLDGFMEFRAFGGLMGFWRGSARAQDCCRLDFRFRVCGSGFQRLGFSGLRF